MERRSKLANAIALTQYNIICLCETWLSEDINDSELLLSDYSIFRSDRERQRGSNMHGGVLIAIRKSFNAELVKHEQPECCITLKVLVDGIAIHICCFYNPPKGSNYCYELSDFHKFVKSVPNNAPNIQRSSVGT